MITYDGYRLSCKGNHFEFDGKVPVTDILDILNIPYTVNEVTGHIRPTGYDLHETPENIDLTDDELWQFVVEAMSLGLISPAATTQTIYKYR